MRAGKVTTTTQRFGRWYWWEFSVSKRLPEPVHEDAFKEPNKLHIQNTVPF